MFTSAIICLCKHGCIAGFILVSLFVSLAGATVVPAIFDQERRMVIRSSFVSH